MKEIGSGSINTMILYRLSTFYAETRVVISHTWCMHGDGTTLIFISMIFERPCLGGSKPFCSFLSHDHDPPQFP